LTKVKLGLFFLGIFCFFLAILAELGMGLAFDAPSSAQLTEAAAPGVAIRMLALVDAGLAWTLILMAIDMVKPLSAVARIQGIVTLILSFFGVLGGIILIFLTFTLLTLMVSLLLAVPFGTIAYLAVWGTFPSGTVRAILASILLLKFLGLGLFVIASPAMLKNKGLIILLIFSLGTTFITGFLLALVPGFVAAIVDMIGALIAAVLGTIWLFVMLIGAIFAVLRAIRSLAPG
jgi:hypothetical protein